MNKFLKYLFFLFLLIFGQFCYNPVYSENSLILKGFVKKIPDTFFGSWRVVSVCEETNSFISFKKKSVDLWNLSQENEVIVLTNPFLGAVANISVDNVNGSSISFTKVVTYNKKIITDIVNLTIEEETFDGYDIVKIDTLSENNDNIIKTETAKYKIKGEKIAGQSVEK